MRALTFWKKVTMDKADFLTQLVDLFRQENIAFAVIGGQGVNAYVEPLVSLDLALAVATDQLNRAEALLAARFQVKQFPHSLNVSHPDSDLRVQIQTDARYAESVSRAVEREVLGLTLPVADRRDILQGKIWAAQDPERRPSKQAKDRLGILRLVERYPEMRELVPADLLARLL